MLAFMNSPTTGFLLAPAVFLFTLLFALILAFAGAREHAIRRATVKLVAGLRCPKCRCDLRELIVAHCPKCDTQYTLDALWDASLIAMLHGPSY